jgi:hypothetical protein
MLKPGNSFVIGCRIGKKQKDSDVLTNASDRKRNGQTLKNRLPEQKTGLSLQKKGIEENQEE